MSINITSYLATCTTNATERATIFAEPYIFAFACLCGLLAAISSL